MRASLFVVSLLAASVAFAQAPGTQPATGEDLVRVDGGPGLLWAPSSKTYGLGGVVEAKYLPSHLFAVGARFEGGVRAGGSTSTESTSINLGTGVAALAKAELLFPLGDLRPFLGVAGGYYSLTGQGLQGGGGGGAATTDTGRYFGLAPQAGVDFGSWRLGATYHALFGPQDVSRNYVGLDVLFVIWRSPRPTGQETPVPPNPQ